MENKKIYLDIEKIKSVDLSHLIDKVSREDLKPCINWPEGTSHYKLLSNIAEQLNNSLIIDLGTHHGLSCLALSTNQNNRIISYLLFNNSIVKNIQIFVIVFVIIFLATIFVISIVIFNSLFDYS